MAKKEYVVCPLCGFNKVLQSMKRMEKIGTENLKWAVLDLDTAFILQVREGGGKKSDTGAIGRGKAPGSGFHLVESESLTLSEMLQDGAYSDILSQMRDQLIRVIKQSIEIGFISIDDLV